MFQEYFQTLFTLGQKSIELLTYNLAERVFWDLLMIILGVNIDLITSEILWTIEPLWYLWM